jgi:hypothetical protein
MPVILDTWETEIRRTKVFKTLSQKYPTQKGLVEWLKR